MLSTRAIQQAKADVLNLTADVLEHPTRFLSRRIRRLREAAQAQAPGIAPPTTVERWRGMLREHITPDVHDVYLRRSVFHKVAQIVEDNPNLPPSYFLGFISDLYGIAQAVAVRRQADTRTDVATLGRLLADLHVYAATFTRADWIERTALDVPGNVPARVREAQRRHNINEADRKFTELFAPSGGPHLEPAVVRADRHKLKQAAGAARRHVNEHIAHLDPDRHQFVATFDEMNHGIDTIGELLRKYSVLVGEGVGGLTPIIQENWLAIFEQPWIAPGV